MTQDRPARHLLGVSPHLRASGLGAAEEMWANLRAESRPGGMPLRWVSIDDALLRRAAAITAGPPGRSPRQR